MDNNSLAWGIQNLVNGFVPLLLVLSGLLFLFFGIGGQIRKSDSGEKSNLNQNAARILGGILLLIGITLYLVPSRTVPASGIPQEADENTSPVENQAAEVVPVATTIPEQATPRPPQPTPTRAFAQTGTEIPFIVEGDFSDLLIHRLSAVATGEHIRFNLEYQASADRNFSFFDPPGGDWLMFVDVLPSNRSIVSFDIPITDLARIDTITMKFFNAERFGYIFLSYPSIADLMTVAPAPVLPPTTSTQENTIDFIYASDWSFHDLIIESLIATRSGDYLIFSFSYISDFNRSFSFFNPSSGDIVMHFDQLPAGKNTLFFEILVSDLERVDAITFCFFLDDRDACIFLSYPDIAILLGSTNPTSMPVSNPSQGSNIGYVKASDWSFFDLIIESLTAIRLGDFLQFTFTYESDISRQFSFFDPPGGDVIKIVDILPAGVNVLTFEIPVAELEKVDDITMCFFYDSKDACVFISFPDIEALLNN